MTELLAIAVAIVVTSAAGKNVLFISLANIWANSMSGVLRANVSEVVLFAMWTIPVALDTMSCWIVMLSSNSCVWLIKLSTLYCQK